MIKCISISLKSYISTLAIAADSCEAFLLRDILLLSSINTYTTTYINGYYVNALKDKFVLVAII